MKFREDRDNQVLCKKKLSQADVRAFRDAVKGDYYFQVRVCGVGELRLFSMCCLLTT